MLYIHPDECIDCGACVPACPVEAIFALDETPEKWKSFIPDERAVLPEVRRHRRACDWSAPRCLPSVVSCFLGAAVAAVFTLGPRAAGQAAQQDPAARSSWPTELFESARYREALDAYDLAIRRAATLTSSFARARGRYGRRCGSRSSSSHGVEAETLSTTRRR